MPKAIEIDLLAQKNAILVHLETAFNITYADDVKRYVSTEHRMLVIIEKQAGIINKLIEKNNKLATAVMGPQAPQRDKNGIIVVGG